MHIKSRGGIFPDFKQRSIRGTYKFQSLRSISNASLAKSSEVPIVFKCQTHFLLFFSKENKKPVVCFEIESFIFAVLSVATITCQAFH